MHKISYRVVTHSKQFIHFNLSIMVVNYAIESLALKEL